MNHSTAARPQRLTAGHTRALAMGAVLAMLLGLVGPAQADTSTDGVRVTTPVRITAEDAAPARTYQSPSMAVHPEDPTTAVAAATDLRARTCRFMRSTNSGHSWELLDERPMADPDVDDCHNTGGTFNQTPIATGGGGRIYYGHTSWPEGTTGPRDHAASELNANVAHSDDVGDSWTTVSVRDSEDYTGEGFEGNRIVSVAAEARGGDDDIVYAAWDTRYGGLDERPPGRPTLAVSEDGGRSFSEPIIPIPEDVIEELGGDDYSAGRVQLAVDDEGAVYAVFPSTPDEEDGRLAVTRSEDQGETWSYHEITDPDGPRADYQMVAWSPEGGPDGTLHVVYESDTHEQPSGSRDIYHQRSTGDLDSWSEPARVNDDDPDAYYGQYNANIDVAPDGRVSVAWFDFRNGQERYANDIYYAFSNDNGDSWSDNIRVSDQSSNRHVGTWSNDFDMRSPPGIASTEEFTLVGWSDTRNADQAGQSQDIYGAAVQHRELSSGGAGVLPLVLAAVGGLVAAGLLLLGIGLGMRSFGRPPRDTAPAAS